MKHLNDIKGFRVTSMENNSVGNCFTTVCTHEESFWLRECKKLKDNLWQGIVDTHLIFTEEYDLSYNDIVTFSTGK